MNSLPISEDILVFMVNGPYKSKSEKNKIAWFASSCWPSFCFDAWLASRDQQNSRFKILANQVIEDKESQQEEVNQAILFFLRIGFVGTICIEYKNNIGNLLWIFFLFYEETIIYYHFCEYTGCTKCATPQCAAFFWKICVLLRVPNVQFFTKKDLIFIKNLESTIV